MPRISVTGPAGSTIRLAHAEVLHRDGTINRRTCGGNRGLAYWQYTKATDDLKTWLPQFFMPAADIRTAWLQKFRLPDGTYGTNSQCVNALALEMQPVEPQDRKRVLEHLVHDIRAKGNATTAGDVGHRFVLQALAHGGYSGLVYRMINQDERPGYGYQLKQGATSLAEA